jgi:hypothetical protein
MRLLSKRLQENAMKRSLDIEKEDKSGKRK